MQTLDGLLKQLNKLKADGVDGGTPVVYQTGGQMYIRLDEPDVDLVDRERAAQMDDFGLDEDAVGDAEQIIVL